MQGYQPPSPAPASTYLDRFPKTTPPPVEHIHFGTAYAPLAEVPSFEFEHHFDSQHEYDPYHPESYMRSIHDSHDPLLDKLTQHERGHHHPLEFTSHYGHDAYSPHRPEWPSESEYEADQTAEYDYFAGMFSKPKAPPKPASPPQAKSKPTTLPPMK